MVENGQYDQNHISYMSNGAYQNIDGFVWKRNEKKRSIYTVNMIFFIWFEFVNKTKINGVFSKKICVKSNKFQKLPQLIIN